MTVHLVEYSPPDPSNPSSSWTNAFIEAINDVSEAGGGIVIVQARSTPYMTGLIDLPSNVIIQGEGMENTTIKLEGTTATTLLQTTGFATDTGSNSQGQFSFGLRDLTLEGNRQAGDFNDSYGNGVQLYGYNPLVERVRFRFFKGNGLWTEYGGGAPDPIVDPNNRGKRVEGLFSDCLFTHNGYNGWVCLGPHDSVIRGCIAQANGRSGINQGESNIWIAARRYPSTYTIKKVQLDQNDQPVSSFELSSCGRAYVPGPILTPVAGNYPGLIAFATLEPKPNVNPVEYEVKGAIWPYRAVLNGSASNDGRRLAPHETEIPWVCLFNSITNAADLAKGTVKVDPLGRINGSGFTITEGGKGYKWANPKVTISASKADGNDVPYGTGNEGGWIRLPVILPIIVGGRVFRTVIIDPGLTKDITVPFFGKAIVSQRILDNSLSENTSAKGAVTFERVGTSNQWQVSEIQFGDPGALIKSADFTYSVAETQNQAGWSLKCLGTFDRHGAAVGWTANDPGGAVPHAFKITPQLVVTPQDPSGKFNGWNPLRLYSSAGGALLSECHVYGAQSFGFRLEIGCVLSSCEAEGTNGPNLFIEGSNGTVDEMWIYNTGGDALGFGGVGATQASGVLLGGYTNPENWRISGKVDYTQFAGLWMNRSNGANVIELSIRSSSGQFHMGDIETVTSSTSDQAGDLAKYVGDEIKITAFSPFFNRNAPFSISRRASYRTEIQSMSYLVTDAAEIDGNEPNPFQPTTHPFIRWKPVSVLPAPNDRLVLPDLLTVPIGTVFVIRNCSAQAITGEVYAFSGPGVNNQRIDTNTFIKLFGGRFAAFRAASTSEWNVIMSGTI